MDALTPDETTWLVKESPLRNLVISYMRIVDRLQLFRNVTIAIGPLTVMWFPGHFFSVRFQCTPIDNAW